MFCGMIPAFPLPGEMTPGQLGPISRVAGRLARNAITFSMSTTGMPSVMQTTSSMPASAASMIASAANGGGTKMTDALAPVFPRASATVLKMAKPSCVVPPLPGDVPPTTLVPYAAACLPWNVPSRPVNPWTRSRVFMSRRTAMVIKASRRPPLRSLPCERHDFFRRLAHRIRGRKVQAALLQHPLAFLDVRAFHPDDDRHRYAKLLHRCDDSRREHIAPENSAEDVDQDGLHVLVQHQDAERVLDLLGIRAAADVEKVRRLAPRQLDDVHRRHREAGAVDHAADVAVEANVVQ